MPRYQPIGSAGFARLAGALPCLTVPSAWPTIMASATKSSQEMIANLR